MMLKKLQYLFRNYFEVAAFSVGLLLLALMNPEAANGPSLCLFDLLGFDFCPGKGLGHSIAFIARGEFSSALRANILGFFAILILLARISYLLYQRLILNNQINTYHNGTNDRLSTGS